MNKISVDGPTLGEDTSLEATWNRIAGDIALTAGTDHEFPLSHMSRSVAEELWSLSRHVLPDHIDALDVGTGTGVHAILMAAKGFPKVSAIDVNEVAVRLASARADRLLDPIARRAVKFLTRSVDDPEEIGQGELGLVTFNPPSYYQFGDASQSTPAQTGVYVDHDWREALKPEDSFLYRFFQHIVLPKLAIGGHVICSWAGLERRNVEDVVDRSSRVTPVSPARLLERWFEMKVSGDSLAPTEFFRYTAVITGDYGLGAAFRANLTRGIAAGLYSQLVQNETRPSFRYGILHLVRESYQHFKTYKNDVGVRSC